ncbi:hypothetical protein Cs7R123_45300 [Catellatospora sp. TT07R-123]|nr:hypothetical protein Cs7R123_45300 [Catellatospora sp. TT07R-123]
MVLAVCLGVPTYFVYAYVSDAQTVKELPGPAAAYFDALIAGDHGKGYDLMCQSRRSWATREEWRGDRNMEPHVVGYRVIKGRVNRDTEGPISYSVEIELRYSDGGVERISLPMVQEHSAWKVCTDRGY